MRNMGELKWRYEGPIKIHYLLLLLVSFLSYVYSITVIDANEEKSALCVAVENISKTLPDQETINNTQSSFDLGSDTFSFCALVRPQEYEPKNKGSFFTYEIGHTNINAGVWKLRLWIQAFSNISIFNDSLNLNSWNMVCFGLDYQEYQVWADINGKFQGTLETTDFRTFSKDGLCLAGTISAMTLQQGNMRKDGRQPETCKDLLDRGSLMKINSVWKKYGNVEILDYKREELCTENFQYLHFKDLMDFYTFNTTCRAFGGSFRPQDLDDILDINSVENIIHSIRKGNETFVTWIDDEDSSSRKRNIDDESSLCTTLLTNGDYTSVYCLRELQSNFCRVPEWLRFTLYGPVKGYDHYYFLKIASNGTYYFQGIKTSMITQERNAWVLRSNLHKKSWYLSNPFEPVGRRLWTSNKENATLTFSPCMPSEFALDEGHCIPRSQRCNGIQESPDRSDEKLCHERRVKKGEGYDPEDPPILKSDENNNVFYHFYIYHIADIRAEQATAFIDMAITLNWLDHRLMYVDLQNDKHYIPGDDIWHPEIGLIAGHGSGPEIDMHCYMKKFSVRKDPQFTEILDLDDSYMGKLTAGSQQNLTAMFQCRVALPCYFNLKYYPFGTQNCSASFYLMTAYGLKWKPRARRNGTRVLPYNELRHLLDYYLFNITEEASERGHYAVITFHLRGKYGYYAANNFAPSALMFLIGYTTLYFPIKDFNERIMVSLTGLLVLAALFTQATSSYPKTPYLKLIDLWYAIQIILCFIVVITNALVNNLRTWKSNDKFSEEYEGKLITDTSMKRAEMMNLICKITLLSAFIILTIVISCYAAELFEV